MGDGGLAETQRDGLRERVRERYAEAATTVLETGRQASCCDSDCGADQGNSSVPCCGPTVIEVDETFGGVLYSLAERDESPLLPPAWAAAIPPPSRNFTRANVYLISALAAVSTYCSQLGE